MKAREISFRFRVCLGGSSVSSVATRPLKIEVGASGAVENLALELLPDARATVERR